jgi:hypothetical protein
MTTDFGGLQVYGSWVKELAVTFYFLTDTDGFLFSNIHLTSVTFFCQS